MIKILLTIIGLYLLIVILTYFFQGRMVFYPDRHLSVTPESIGLTYEEVQLWTSDGVCLQGWFIPGSKEQVQSTVLFFHGNAGNISHRMETLDIIHKLNLSCLIFDYRGYGQSQGSPTEKGLYKDGQAAWSWLLQKKGLQPKEIICWGRSLGGPIAARLARDKLPGGLIIESTFTSLTDMGQKLYPFLPVKLISRFRFPTQKYVQDLSCPVLLVHSTEDDLVPFVFGQKLFESAPEPKRLLKIKGGHNDGFLVSGEHYKQGVKDFLKEFKLM